MTSAARLAASCVLRSAGSAPWACCTSRAGARAAAQGAGAKLGESPLKLRKGDRFKGRLGRVIQAHTEPRDAQPLPELVTDPLVRADLLHPDRAMQPHARVVGQSNAGVNVY